MCKRIVIEELNEISEGDTRKLLEFAIEKKPLIEGDWGFSFDEIIALERRLDAINNGSYKGCNDDPVEFAVVVKHSTKDNSTHAKRHSKTCVICVDMDDYREFINANGLSYASTVPVMGVAHAYPHEFGLVLSTVSAQKEEDYYRLLELCRTRVR
jgi:hypothetical protein